MSKQIWVSPNEEGGRRVHKPGAQRDSAHTNTKAEATQRAEVIARREKLETKIQNLNGQISGGNSYGNDPFPPRDRK